LHRLRIVRVTVPHRASGRLFSANCVARITGLARALQVQRRKSREICGAVRITLHAFGVKLDVEIADLGFRRQRRRRSASRRRNDPLGARTATRGREACNEQRAD
jgi:hypothetical protein